MFGIVTLDRSTNKSGEPRCLQQDVNRSHKADLFSGGAEHVTKLVYSKT